MMKIFTVASVPDELAQAWLQHLRDFDASHPGCHFEVAADAPDLTVSEMVDAMRVRPPLTFTQIFLRADAASGRGRPIKTKSAPRSGARNRR